MYVRANGSLSYAFFRKTDLFVHMCVRAQNRETKDMIQTNVCAYILYVRTFVCLYVRMYGCMYTLGEKMYF